MKNSSILTHILGCLWIIARGKVSGGVALPPQSRFATGDEARIGDIVRRELGPIQTELEHLKSQVERQEDGSSSGPRFQQEMGNNAPSSSASSGNDNSRKRHKEKVGQTRVPKR
eukprot:Gregarina_sp_Pseudo_9__433@NODE_127_length_4112_cov_20_272772_g119_i0_p9_GENE_NODE_127_length_4112_cov_20_272772_g119_i0NODE_127_length_4112_cov_20_272772_g119_i0_p9_ORF_typecomplete_len114_score8_74_NODE_127_length_4112_cov_20_272772_g119_i023692710